MYSDYYSRPEQHINVLFLDENPELAAQAHCDGHLGKMIVAACQVLSSVWFQRPCPAATLDWGPPVGAAPPGGLACLNSHLAGQRIHHPVYAAHLLVQWAGALGGNYDWVYRLAYALLSELAYRQERVHACQPVVRSLEKMPPWLLGSVGEYRDAPAIVPAEYVRGGTVQSYRAYYTRSRSVVKAYTRRSPPSWLEQ